MVDMKSVMITAKTVKAVKNVSKKLITVDTAVNDVASAFGVEGSMSTPDKARLIIAEASASLAQSGAIPGFNGLTQDQLASIARTVGSAATPIDAIPAVVESLGLDQEQASMVAAFMGAL